MHHVPVTWVSLLPPLSDQERDEYARAVTAATGLARNLADAAGWTTEQRRIAALGLHADRVRSEDPPSGTVGQAMTLLARHDIAWTRTDLVWALHLLDRSGELYGDSEQVPATIAAGLDAEQLAGLGPVLRAVLDGIYHRFEIPADVRRDLIARFSAGIDRAEPGVVPAHLLHGGDTFGPDARAALAGVLAGPGVAAALTHATTLKHPVPSATWTRTAAALLPPAAEAVHGVLDRFAAHGHTVHDDTDALLRGLACMLATDDSTAATRLIERVAVGAGSSHPRSAGYPFAPRTAAAAAEILAGRPGDGPVRTLALLSLRVRNKALLTRIRSALERAGAARGWQPGEAQELAVDDHGLDRDATRTWYAEGCTVVLEIGEDKPRLRFERDGTPVRSMPAALTDSPVLAEARTVLKAVTATLAAERIRVEALMSQDRGWTPADWAARYLDHPVTATLARRLIWQSDAGPGIPERVDGGWRIAGQPPAGPVRLWHPLDASPDEVGAWRDRVTTAGLRQPFKQAFREVYRVTPAEAAAGTHSDRYAEHILLYRQANALMRTRGWQADYLGSWDGGHRSDATKLLGGGDWRVSLRHRSVEAAGVPSYPVVLCTTEQVWFAHRDTPHWTVPSMVDVPARVFSEAMRDVDLFVGVTSIATDEQWAENTGHELFPYWRAESTAPLTARAEVRRDALALLLPQLPIAGRCELTGRYLRVRGTRRTYRIHLGSGNILMEPDDAYLCIVPAKAPGPRVLLPFDDDPTLSIVLSKALMLAADDRITDPAILRQLS